MIGRTNAGGGGTGATLTVNAPAGVSVIATNSTTGRTYTRTANSSGVAVFKGLPTGTYLVHITDGTTTSKDFTATVVADYDLTVKFFAAYINVTYPSGSTCTCSDGVTTLTATTTTGSYQFVVPNTGTWTVNCTNDTQSTSANVSITADEQTESVTLSYFAATISITYPATSNCVVKNSSGETVASDSNTSSSTKTWTATVLSTGTYTVTATSTSDSSKTKSQTVSVTSNGQSASVTLSYIQYIIDNGTINTAVAGTINAEEQTKSGNYLILGGSGHNWFTLTDSFSKQISTVGYKKLTINWCMSKINAAETNTKYVKLSVGAAASVTTESRSTIVTSTIDLTSVQGTYTFSFTYQGGSSYDAYYTVQNLFLT